MIYKRTGQCFDLDNLNMYDPYLTTLSHLLATIVLPYFKYFEIIGITIEDEHYYYGYFSIQNT